MELRFLPDAEVYSAWECAIHGAPETDNPFADPPLAAVVTEPDGAAREIAGFYDGEGVYRLRYYPGKPGGYKVALRLRAGQTLESWELVFHARPGASKGRLRVNPEYPHTFAYEDGTPYYMIGSGMEGPLPQELDHRKLSLSYLEDDRDVLAEWRAYMDMLCEHGFNRVRMFWAWMSHVDVPGHEGMMYRRLRDKFERDPQTGRHILDRFNTAAWRLLDDIIRYGHKKGIVFELVVFDRCCLENWEGRQRWECHAYNKANGGPVPSLFDDDRSLDGQAVDPEHFMHDRRLNGKRGFFDIAFADPADRENWTWQMENGYYQKVYVDYLLARTSAYPNVYYEVINEIERKVGPWMKHWFRYIRERDPFGHLITCSPVCFNENVQDKSALFDHFKLEECDFMSPHNPMIPDTVGMFTKPYWGLGKPVVFDEVFWVGKDRGDGPPSDGDYAQERVWFYANFFCGAHTTRVCWQPFRPTPACKDIRVFSEFIKQYPWWKRDVLFGAVETSEGLTAYAVEIDREILIYCVGSGALSMPGRDGRFRVRRFDPSTGEWSREDGIAGVVSLEVRGEPDCVVSLTLA